VSYGFGGNVSVVVPSIGDPSPTFLISLYTIMGVNTTGASRANVAYIFEANIYVAYNVGGSDIPIGSTPFGAVVNGTDFFAGINTLVVAPQVALNLPGYPAGTYKFWLQGLYATSGTAPTVTSLTMLDPSLTVAYFKR
jgi:hypothetical protein